MLNQYLERTGLALLLALAVTQPTQASGGPAAYVVIAPIVVAAYILSHVLSGIVLVERMSVPALLNATLRRAKLIAAPLVVGVWWYTLPWIYALTGLSGFTGFVFSLAIIFAIVHAGLCFLSLPQRDVAARVEKIALTDFVLTLAAFGAAALVISALAGG